MALSPGGRFFAALDKRGGRFVIRIWDTRTRKEVELRSTQRISDLALSADGRVLASSGETIDVRDIGSRAVVRSIPKARKSDDIALSADGWLLARWSSTKLQLWNVNHRAPRWSVKASKDRLMPSPPTSQEDGAGWRPVLRFIAGDRLLLGGEHAWDVSSGKRVSAERIPSFSLRSSKGSFRVPHGDKKLETGSLELTEEVKSIPGSWGVLDGGRLVLIPGRHGMVHVYESSTGSRIAALLPYHQHRLLAFLEGGYVEVLGGDPPPALLCRFGTLATSFDVCRERWLVSGGLAHLLEGDHGYKLP